MADRILLVTGLGRCGTTLVMHMLRAAGVPVAGRAPAFEDHTRMGRTPDLDWLAQQRGRAVKWIDPTLCKIPAEDDDRYRAIFLSREAKEQARSQLKFSGCLGNRDTLRGMTKVVERDTIRARRIVRRLCGDYGVLFLRFENLVNFPAHEARKIALFCDALGLPFGDEGAAAAQVLRRPVTCAPDLSIEARLMLAGGGQ